MSDRATGAAASRAAVRAPRLLSARAYAACVALATSALLALFALLRPSVAHTLASALGLERLPPQSPQSFYAVRVAPILDEHCAGCHGAHRQKAKLRLDTLAAALRGGRHGAVIIPGHVGDSAVAQRIALPRGDARAMPPASQSPLSPDDATVIRLWIAAGASGTQPVADFKTAPRPVARVTIADVDPQAVATARAPIAAALQALQQRFPGAIAYESRSSANVELNASLLGRRFGDAELAALAPLREHIVRVDLSGTSVGEAAATVLEAMPALRVLRIMDVRAGPALRAELQALRQRGVRVHAEDDDVGR